MTTPAMREEVGDRVEVGDDCVGDDDCVEVGDSLSAICHPCRRLDAYKDHRHYDKEYRESNGHVEE